MTLRLDPPPLLEAVDTLVANRPQVARPWVQWISAMYSVLNSVIGTLGGQYLSNPCGAFSNSTTQAVTAANTPYVVVLNTTDVSNGVTLSSNKMTVAQAGTYNIQFSLQFENTGTNIVEEFVWLRKNGTNIAGTASSWSVAAKHGAVNGYALGACNFFVTLAAGDYIELVVAADDVGTNIEAYAASSSPFTRPSIPSSVVTLSFVSA